MPSSKKSTFYTGFFRQTLFAQISLIIIFIALIWFFSWSFLEFDLDQANLLGNSASLIMDADGSKRMFTGEVIDGMSVLDSLIASSKAGNFDFEYLNSATGDVEVISVSHFKAGSSELYFYLNEQQVSMADLNRILLHPGDEVRIVIR